MKVAMIFFDLSIPAGGQRQFLSLAQELKSRGHEIKIYTLLQNKKIFPNLWQNLDITVVKLNDAKINILQKILFFNKDYYNYINKAISVYIAMDKDFDVINCHEDFAYRVGYFYKKNNHKTKIIWSLNNVSYFYNKSSHVIANFKSYILNFYKNIRENRFYRQVNMVAPLSKYEEKWCLDRNLRATIVRSGLNFQEFYKPVKRVQKDDNFCVLSIGALGPHRRFEDTIRAVKILRNEGFSVNAKIVCKKITGNNSDDYENTIRELISEVDLQKHVELLTAGASDIELSKIYDQSHIFMHPVYLPPPQYYGWGLVVFEAMASGLPIVLCRTTGATEVLTDKENSLFAKPLDSKDFSDKIRDLISNPDYYNYISKNGQEFVRNNISWSKYTDSMLKLFI